MSNDVSCCNGGSTASGRPSSHFDNMIATCLDHCHKTRQEGRPVVGIMCEFTPRELIMAAGAVPVCLCGGSASTIAVAEEQLPANLCPLIKSTFGYHVKGLNPFLEMADLIVAETTCDGKKKMYELMGETRAMYVLRLSHVPNSNLGAENWRNEVRLLKEKLEESFSVRITDDALRKAAGVMNRERRLRRAIAESMKKDSPPLTGLELLKIKSSVSGVCADFAAYESILDWLATYEESEDGRKCARVLLTGVPTVHGAERVVRIIEDAGAIVVASENCTGLKPILEDVDESREDILEAIADKYYHLPCSVMSPNDDRMELIATLAREYRADCVIDLIWQACLTYDVESARVKKLCEETLQMPYMRIETDYSPSDSARIQVRVEALMELVQERRTT